MDGLLKLQSGFQLGAEEPSVRQPAPFRHMEQGGQKGVPAIGRIHEGQIPGRRRLRSQPAQGVASDQPPAFARDAQFLQIGPDEPRRTRR